MRVGSSLRFKGGWLLWAIASSNNTRAEFHSRPFTGTNSIARFVWSAARGRPDRKVVSSVSIGLIRRVSQKLKFWYNYKTPSTQEDTTASTCCSNSYVAGSADRFCPDEAGFTDVQPYEGVVSG